VNTEQQLSPEHAAYLAANAVDLDVAIEAGVRSEEGGIVFPWRSPDGRVVEQFRPDDPGEDGPKYLWRKGEPLVLWAHPRVDGLVRSKRPIVVVEGTKQYLAAISATDGEALVLGVVGCQGWRQAGKLALDDLGLIPWRDRDVTIVFDADVDSNPDVYDAAVGLEHDLTFRGAASVKHARLPGDGKAGLDDVIATYGPEALERVLSTAGPISPTRPMVARRYFDRSGLKVATLADDALDRFPMAVNIEAQLCVYEGGVYRRDPKAATIPAVRLLRERYRPMHASALEDVLVDRLRSRGRRLTEHASEPILNLSNGLLDLQTLDLHPHSPDFLSSVQLPIAWNPDAECPVYEQWVAECVGSQVDDLEETVSVMLDPTRTPTKALFCFGPSRSGKSTFIRLAEAIAGAGNRSAVTLHQLCTDRFAAANLYGAILNSAADLSATHVEDLSTFKMLTGEDTVQANRKYGRQFEFKNAALFAFSANEIPSVGESSTAYLERVKPIFFPHSFAGAEDRSIEEAMHRDELPGILRRWVEAYRRLDGRGGRYGPTDPTVGSIFAERSDRVRQWVAEETTRLGPDVPVDRWTPGPEAFAAFGIWSEANGQAKLGRNKFYDRLRSAGLDIRPSTKHRSTVSIRLGRCLDIPSVSRAGERSDKAEFGAPSDLGRCDSSALSGRFTAPSPHEGVEEVEVERGKGSRETSRTVRPAPLVFDLETGSVDDLWRSGPEFERIVGRVNCTNPATVVVDTDIAAPVRHAAEGGSLVAHNGFGFDFLALAHHHGLDVLAVGDEGRLVDTKILAFLADPPEARTKSVERYYGLDATAERLGVTGKVGDLKGLASEFGGFDKIPVDDERYLAYCAADIEATKLVFERLPITEYARREMRVLARLTGSISVRGFRVDRKLLDARLAEGAEQTSLGLATLVTDYGLPTTTSNGKPAKSPHRTAEGKAAIAAAFADLGVELPTTEAGSPKLDKETMAIVATECADDAEIVRLADTVRELNGVRTVYGTISERLAGDRVHPLIDARQASGRISVVSPGLTVMGKRGGKFVERDVFIADRGERIVAVDLDQIDARAIAAHCQDSAYIALFAPGLDAHAEVAEMVWGDRSKREAAKAVGHGWNYGMGIAGLVRQGIDESVAVEFDAAMRSRFPGLVEWRDTVRKIAEQGELLDNGFGRMMRPTPDRAWTQGPALIGQGCARDLMMEAVLRLPLEVVAMLRAVVHDELVFSIPTSSLGDVTTTIVEAMSFEWRGVPITAGASKPGRTWGDVYRKEAA
jgi:P4 family phage/plasmid primase-like protien